MDVAEEPFTVKKEKDDSYHVNLSEIQKVKEEPPETAIFVKCEAYNENYISETDCAHHEDIKLGIKKEESEQPTLDSVCCQVTGGTYEYVTPKLENEWDPQDSILELTNTKVRLKHETLSYSSDYSADVGLYDSETKQIETENDESRRKEDNLEIESSVEDGDSSSKKCEKVQIVHEVFLTEELLDNSRRIRDVHVKRPYEVFLFSGRLEGPYRRKAQLMRSLLEIDFPQSLLVSMIHKEERPFSCKFCLKSFVRRYAAKRNLNGNESV